MHVSAQFKGTSERGLYGDVVQELDHSVGRVLKELEAQGLMENTLIVFSSDNGAKTVWQHKADYEGEPRGKNEPYRQGKATTFEGGLRVPTLMMWKGHLPDQKEEHRPMIMMDLYVTFASLAGYSMDDLLTDGKDLMPFLTQDRAYSKRTFYFYMHQDLQVVRKGDWKYKAPFEGVERKGWNAHGHLLFDLQADAEEENNLLNENREKARELIDSLKQFNTRWGSPDTLIEYLN